jgi:hypothetical protein
MFWHLNRGYASTSAHTVGTVATIASETVRLLAARYTSSPHDSSPSRVEAFNVSALTRTTGSLSGARVFETGIRRVSVLGQLLRFPFEPLEPHLFNLIGSKECQIKKAKN